MALAIALGREPPHHDDPPEGPDSFLADNGFEYIDGERTRHPERPSASATVENGGDGDGDDNNDDDDVQGLPRVIDALSTIMWPTMVREQNGSSGGKRNKTQLQPSLFDFDDVLLRAENENGEPDEEQALAALMAADAADHGLPLTRASRVQREMHALERWLVENEEMHEADFGCGTGIDDDADDADKGENKDEDDDDDDKNGGGGDAPLSSLQAPVLDIRVISKDDDDPWVASSASNPTLSTSTAQQHSTAAPSSGSGSGFDDDFSAFVSAPPPAVSSFPVCGLASAWASTSGPGPGSLAPARPHSISQSLLKPSHTGGSFRSLHSAVSDVDVGDVLGYEALDDRSSLGFSPEHEHERGTRAFDGDAEPTNQQFGGRAAGLGDVPFDLTNILSTLDTMREDMAGIENEDERKARTARFASEFVFKGMSVDGDKREGIED